MDRAPSRQHTTPRWNTQHEHSVASHADGYVDTKASTRKSSSQQRCGRPAGTTKCDNQAQEEGGRMTMGASENCGVVHMLVVVVAVVQQREVWRSRRGRRTHCTGGGEEGRECAREWQTENGEAGSPVQCNCSSHLPAPAGQNRLSLSRDTRDVGPDAVSVAHSTSCLYCSVPSLRQHERRRPSGGQLAFVPLTHLFTIRITARRSRPASAPRGTASPTR